MFKFILPLAAIILVFASAWLGGVRLPHSAVPRPETAAVPIPSPTTPAPTAAPLPPRSILTGGLQVFQTFNNCGPAALSMALSHFGIDASQTTLGNELRPYQNAAGDNDDKTVTMEELAAKARSYGLLAYHRPDGSLDLVKRFLALGLPVITRTWLTPDEDIGHYRVVTGYDDTRHAVIQDDSMQGAGIVIGYGPFDAMWNKFGHEYLVLVPKDKQREAEVAMGADRQEETAWRNAEAAARLDTRTHPDDPYLRFNYSVALYHTGAYAQAVAEYELVADRLPRRTLWYQTEPIEAYAALGQYDRVFAITDAILNGGDRAYTELYLIRGRVYQKQGNPAAAKREFVQAVRYNDRSAAAADALKSVE